MKTTLAKVVSTIFEPLLIAPLFALINFIISFEETGLKLILILFSLGVIVPVIVFLVLWRLKIISDFHIRERPERNIVYLTFVICLMSALAVNLAYHGPFLLTRLLTLATLLTLIFLVVNLFLKLSTHVSVPTALFTYLALTVHLYLGLLLLFIPLVAWSRFVLKRHSLVELVAGFLASIMPTLLILSAFTYFYG